jgi:hypothetical protein
VGPTDFTTSLPFAKTAMGRIAVDDRLRVLVHPQKDHGPSTPAEVHPTTNVSSAGPPPSGGGLQTSREEKCLQAGFTFGRGSAQ